METVPNNNENVEAITNYEEKCEAGIARAEEIVGAIDDFDKLDYRGQYAALHEALNKLFMDGESYLAIENIAARMTEIEKLEERDKIDIELEQIRQYYGREADASVKVMEAEKEAEAQKEVA